MLTYTVTGLGRGALGALPESQLQAFAQQIFAIVKKDQSGMSFSGVEDIFRLIPVADREEVARRVVLLGGGATGVLRSLQWANEADAKAAADAKGLTPLTPPKPAPVVGPPPAMSTGKKVGIAAAVGVVALGGLLALTLSGKKA